MIFAKTALPLNDSKLHLSMQTNKFPFGFSFGYQIYHKCKQQPPFSTKRTLGHLFQEVNRAELEENCELWGTDNHSDPIIQTQYMSKGKYPSMFWLWTGPFVDFLPGVKKTLVKTFLRVSRLHTYINLVVVQGWNKTCSLWNFVKPL